MRLGRLIADTAVREVVGEGDPEITDLACHSGRVGPGTLFVAVRGMKLDGNRYIDDAVRSGAAAVVTDSATAAVSGAPLVRVADSRAALSSLAAAFFGHPDRDLTMVGLTGTNGKTTVSLLVEAVLEAEGIETMVVGTLGHSDLASGGGGGMVPTLNTTPESLDLMRLLAGAGERGCGAAVMEVTSHALDLGRVADLRFDVALFTNLSRDHLDYHRSMEAYLEAKLKLFGLIKPGGTGVVNADDPRAGAFRRAWSGKRLGYGVSSGAEVTVERVDERALDGRLEMRTPAGRLTVNSRLKGRFNISNNLAAAAVGVALGIDPETIAGGLESLQSVPGRMEEISWAGPFRVYVDYAHTPDSLEKILSALRELPGAGRLITVFGAGGDRDSGKRPIMGRVVSERSDLAVVTSDNPRSEDPLAIIRDIEAGMKGPGCDYRVEPSRRDAIAVALSLAEPGDVVLVAGKGHEPYQEIKGVRHHFDDREEVRERLKQLVEKG